MSQREHVTVGGGEKTGVARRSSLRPAVRRCAQPTAAPPLLLLDWQIQDLPQHPLG
jgi:hypothetical protein